MNGRISDKDAGVERDLAGRGERTFRIGRTLGGEGRVRWGRA